MANRINGNTKSIYIQATNEYFDSVRKAAKAIGLNENTVGRYINYPNKAPQWFDALNVCKIDKLKKCPVCGKTADNQTPSRYGYTCKDCLLKKNQNYRKSHPNYRIDNYYKRIYGITKLDYDKLFKEQNGCCAICGREQDYKPLAVDHNHRTGKVRGLLCNKCNPAIGALESDDGIDVLCSAISYIRNHCEQ